MRFESKFEEVIYTFHVQDYGFVRVDLLWNSVNYRARPTMYYSQIAIVIKGFKAMDCVYKTKTKESKCFLV